MAGDDEVGPLRNNVVGIHAVVFHDPFAAVVRGPKRKFRRGDIAAVVHGNPAGDADETAPGARADDRADFLSMEEPGEGVAAGTRELVDDHNLWPVNRHRWPWDIFPFAWSERGEQLALEFLGVEIRNLAAGVVTLVDDDAVLVELRGELLVKSHDAGDGGVRHVHVANAAASGFLDFATVGVGPIEITDTVFSVNGLHGDFPRALGGRLAVDLQSNESSSKVLEVSIDVLIRMRFLAIDRNEVVARLHF